MVLFAAQRGPAAEDPARLAEQARQRAAQLQLHLEPLQFDDVERVRQAALAGAERGKAEFERQAAERRARTELAVTISEEGLQLRAPPGTPISMSQENPPLAGRLVVAISSSMPEELVREYARQLDGIPEAILVLRGFIGGARAVTPTVEWIERALRKRPTDPNGGHYRVEVVVDPLVFRMLGLTQVPAITFLAGVQDLRHCDAEQLVAARIAYGAVSVGGALDALKSAIAVPDRLRQQLGGTP